MRNPAIVVYAGMSLFISTCTNAQEAVIKKGNNETLPNPVNEFSIAAQIRPRFEYRNGAYRPLQDGETPAILTHNRTRLVMDYANEDKLRLRISAQNINVWGQDAQVVPIHASSGNFSVFEAYGDIKLSHTLRTRIGRQVIALDDERIFGGLDWHPAGRSHDALNISWKSSKAVEVQSYFAYNQNYKTAGWNVNNPVGQFYTPADAQPYQHMQLLYGRFNISKTSYISLLLNNLGFKKDAIANGNVAAAKVNNMQTAGANWFGNHGQWKSQLSAFYQGGKNADGKDKSAYMLSGSAGYQVSRPVGITLGADYLSGDDLGTDKNEKSRYFDPLYGTHHKFYGFMDYYYVPGPNPVGLLDTYMSLSLKPGTKADFGIAGHLFNTAGTVYNGSDKLSSALGSEIDLTFNYKVLPMVTVNGGYSTYFHTATLRTIKSVPDARNYQDWFWLSVNINPKIFTARF
ncbi:alginate export family protein [Niabella aquatica]